MLFEVCSKMTRFSIAITGLPQAGKSSFTQRLLSGTFVSSPPTLGVDVEFTEYQGFPLQIWDMGGHQAFRKHIWKNYINLSSALIFIFDASNLESLTESKEWFYTTLEWIENKNIPVLFLGNKMDLVVEKEKVMEKIVEGFELDKLTSIESKMSFRFFFISVKTGEYISDAMNWLINKLVSKKTNFMPNILSVDIFVKKGDINLHIHDNTRTREKVKNVINAYEKKWLKSSNQKQLSSMEEINFEEYKLLFISYQNIAILVTTEYSLIEKGPLVSLIEKLTEFISTDLLNEETRYLVFQKVKKELEKSFIPFASKTLTCKVISIDNLAKQ